MDFAPLRKGLEGKREAEDAIERESVTAKKQKVEENATETSNDDNVDISKNDPKGSTEKSPVVSWEMKDESCSDNVSPNKVTAESTSPNFAKKEDETNKELELDDGTNSSDDDDDIRSYFYA